MSVRLFDKVEVKLLNFGCKRYLFLFLYFLQLTVNKVAFMEPPPQIWIFVAGYKSLTCHLSSMQGLRFPFSLWSLKEVHSAFAPPDASNVGTGKIWSRAIKKSSAFKFRSRGVFRLNSPLLVWACSFMAPIENLKTRHAKERSNEPIPSNQKMNENNNQPFN